MPPTTALNSDETAAARDGYTVGLSIQNQIGDALKASVRGNRFSIDFESRHYIPVGEFSRADDFHGSLRLTTIPGIDVRETGFQLSVLAFYRYWIQTKHYQVSTAYGRVPKNSIGLPEHTFYVGPLINYRASKAFTIAFGP